MEARIIAAAAAKGSSKQVDQVDLNLNEEELINRRELAVVVEKFLPRRFLRVLLVENDDSTRHIVTALLRKCNYQVTAVADGLKAWALLKRKPYNFDLVLTEVVMPSLSGIGLLSMIMNNELCKTIPVINRGLHACYVPGANDVLCKALKGNELDKATEYINNNPELINLGIAHDSSTSLHVGLYWKLNMKFVEEIVKLMTPIALEYKKTNDNTVLHIAVWRGTTEAVVMLVDKNSNLSQIRNNNRETPLELALHYVTVGQKEIVEYLYSVTRDVQPSPFVGHDGDRLLCKI